MGADHLTTQGALDAEVALRAQGDSRLSSYAGSTLLAGIPDGVAPVYSAHGTLIDLVNGDNLTKSLWKLDDAKQRKITVTDNGTLVLANPSAMNFTGADDDGFLVTVVGTGVVVALDALGKWWTGDPGDGGPDEEISSVANAVQEFAHDRFATGIRVNKILIGHISAVWSVVSDVTLTGRKVKVGANP